MSKEYSTLEFERDGIQYVILSAPKCWSAGFKVEGFPGCSHCGLQIIFGFPEGINAPATFAFCECAKRRAVATGIAL